MRIICISDTHNKHRALTLPEGDVLVHAGDATMRGTIEEFAAFGNWFQKLPYRYKLFVPGNHDFICQKEPALSCELLGSRNYGGLHMLVDQSTRIDGLKFYGSPWVPNLPGWAFSESSDKLRTHFSKIPNDCDVLITHGPPAHVMDEAYFSSTVHYGSHELSQRLLELGPHPRVHIFGHIHEGYGQYEEVGHLYTKTSINACSCNIDYELVNAPMVVDI